MIDLNKLRQPTPIINPYGVLPKITYIQGKLGAYVKKNLAKKQKRARNKSKQAKQARKNQR